MTDLLTVYASIGNSDDKLTQQQWAEFHELFNTLVRAAAEHVHGDWHSVPNAPWQNACMCFEVTPEKAERLKQVLAEAAGEFRQDSIAWAVAETEFVRPESVEHPRGRSFNEMRADHGLPPLQPEPQPDSATYSTGGWVPGPGQTVTLRRGEEILPAPSREA